MAKTAAQTQGARLWGKVTAISIIFILLFTSLPVGMATSGMAQADETNLTPTVLPDEPGEAGATPEGAAPPDEPAPTEEPAANEEAQPEATPTPESLPLVEPSPTPEEVLPLEEGGDEPQPVYWSLTYRPPLSQAELDGMGGIEAARDLLLDAVAGSLTDPGVAYRVEIETSEEGEALALYLEGWGGVEQLRNALYIDLDEIFHFPSRAAELTINFSEGRENGVTLLFEGNLSSGYSWDLEAIEEAGYSINDLEYFPTSEYDGAPSIYQLKILAPSGWNRAISLRYTSRRETRALLDIQINFSSLPEVINLTDPKNPDPASLPPQEYTEGLEILGLTLPADMTLPPTYDWRDYGKVTPEKDQSPCNTCWASSAVALFESALYTYSDEIYDSSDSSKILSEQFLIDCNKAGKDCDTGWSNWEASKYHLRSGTVAKAQTETGGVLLSDLPWSYGTGTCTIAYSHPYKLHDYFHVNNNLLARYKPTVDALKKAIYMYGPAATNLCVNGDLSDSWTGVFSTDMSSACSNEDDKVNHAILIIGWDDNEQAWIIKNSWEMGNGSYFGKIKYNTSEIGSYSFVARMDADPGTPSLSSPSSGAVVPNFTPTLKWKAAANDPKQYELQIATDSKFTNIVHTAVVFPDPQPAYTPVDGLSPNTLFYWRVRAYKLPNRWTTWSSTWSFKTLPVPVPVVYSPTGWQTVERLRPTFYWEAVDGASGYQVRVSRYEDFSSTVISTTVTNPSYTPTSDLRRDTPFFWQVRTKGKYGYSSWSPAEGFWTLNPPGTPSLVAPSSGASLETRQPFFNWKDSSNFPYGYDLFIATDPGFVNLVDTIYAETSEFAYPYPMEPGKYYWKVQARSWLDGSLSNWSSVRWFKTAGRVFGYVTDTVTGSPVVGATVSVSGTTLSTVTDDSGYYNFEAVKGGSRTFVIKQWGYLNLSKSVTVSAGAVTQKDFLLAIDTYKPGTPSLYSPTSGANLTDYAPWFDWSDSSHSPLGYELQVATSTDFIDDLVFDDYVGSYYDSHYPYPYNLGMGIYYWRVRAYNDYGFSSWSSARSFKTPGRLTGYVYDNITKAIIPGMTVAVNGTSLWDVTDSNGYYSISGIQGGSRTLTISGPGYKTTTKTVTVYGGKSTEFKVYLTPSSQTVNIVLTWGSVPTDLDAHLWLPSANPYHVYFYNKGSSLEFPHADLDRDDTTSYGPETITITQNYSGTYRFAVYHYTSSGTVWSSSNAVVKVYKGGSLVKTYSVPKSNTYRWWYVFDYDGSTGAITDRNTMTSSAPGGY